MKSSVAARLDRVSEAVLIGLIIGTPLAFGSVEVWATESMKIGILLFVLLRMASRRALGHRAFSMRVLGAGGFLVPALLFLGIAAIQAVPLPAPLIRLASPATDALYRGNVPGYPDSSDFAGVEGLLLSDPAAVPFAVAGDGVSSPEPRSFRTLSILPAGTRERFGLLFAYLALFYALVDFAGDESRRLRLMLAVTLTGFGIAAFAIVQKLTWNGKIFWIHEPAQGGIPFGPFVNPNHFAGYMELVLPVSLGLLLTVWRHRVSRPVPGSRNPSASAGIVRFPRLEEDTPRLFAGWGEAAVPKTVLIACALGVALTAILLSGSRGGLLATSITFVLFAGVLVPAGFRRRTMLLASIAGTGLASTAMLASFGIGPFSGTIQRLEAAGAEPSYASRWANWLAMRPLVGDHLLLGTGLGTFRQAYAGYYPPGVIGVWSQAHNDYLQVLVEAGLVGGVLAALVLILYARKTFFPALRSGANREIRVGLAMGLVSISLHSLVDFNLQVPANGFLTIVLAATLASSVLALTGRRQEDRNEPSASGLDPVEGASGAPALQRRSSDRRKRPGWRRGLCAGVALLLAAGCLAGSVRRLFGDRLRLAATSSLDNRRFELARLQLESAHEWDPARPDVSRHLGDTLLEMADLVPPMAADARATRGRLLRSALGAHLAALDASPAEAGSWSGVSSVYYAFALDAVRPDAIDLSQFALGAPKRPAPGREPEPSGGARELALAAIERAVSLEPDNFDYRDELAAQLFEAGRDAEALDEIRMSAMMVPLVWRHTWGTPDRWSTVMTEAVRAGVRESLRTNALIPPHEIWRNLGEIALARGDYSEGREDFDRAVGLSPDASLGRNYRYYSGECEQRAGDEDAALRSFTEAAKEPIVEAQARFRRAGILLRRGLGEEALSDFRRAVALRPGDVDYRLGLASAAVEMGKPEIALDALEEAVRLSPRDPEPLRRLAQLYREQGNPGAALRAAQKLVDGWPTVDAFRDFRDSIDSPGTELSGE